MLDDLSERIFTVMQRPFESTGILLPEQIPNYLHLLDEAIQLERNATSKVLDVSEQSTVSKKDPLGRRAFPFMELLKQAQRNNEPVVWEFLNPVGSLENVLPLRGTSQFALQSRLLDQRKPFLH